MLARLQKGTTPICLRTKAFFFQPGFMQDRLGFAGACDKAQGSLVSWHTQRHLPAKSKSSAAEVNLSRLICKPLGFRLKEPCRKAEVSKLTHLQGGSTEKKGRGGNTFNSAVPASRSRRTLQNDFPPEHSETEQRPWGWGEICVTHLHLAPCTKAPSWGSHEGRNAHSSSQSPAACVGVPPSAPCPGLCLHARPQRFVPNLSMPSLFIIQTPKRLSARTPPKRFSR